MKSGGSLAQNALFGASNSQAGRSRVCFAWQAHYFRSVSIFVRRFLVAGATLCACAFYNLGAGAALCDVA